MGNDLMKSIYGTMLTDWEVKEGRKKFTRNLLKSAGFTKIRIFKDGSANATKDGVRYLHLMKSVGSYPANLFELPTDCLYSKENKEVLK